MKIVFGTDGSEQARFAEEFLARYPCKGAHVLCVSVYSTVRIVTATAHPFIGPILADQISAAVEAAKQGAERDSGEAASRLQALGFDAKPVVLEGEPGDRLSRFAESEKADLVVVGSRGEGALEALLLGSVARAVANDSHITVLICRKGGNASGDLEVTFATDHSEFATRVAAKLPSLVDGKFKSLEVLSVMDTDSASLLSSAPDSVQTEPGLAGLDEGLEQWLERASNEIAQGLAPIAERVSHHVASGDARREILKRIEQTHKDLIIVGARGRSGISRLLLGSVSHYVATRAHCSVLIVRA
jgi:nucleotide-binding universal stress UspA family protein